VSALPALESLIDRLHGSGRLRVWSLVITVFGDAIAPRGGRVSLAVLQQIMERLRIEPGALRTALSRLAKDGWVIREKEGRNSFYRLDERGRHAFDLATRRIYAAGAPAWDGRWTCAFAHPGATGDNGAALKAAGFLRVAPGVYLRPETAGSPDARDELAGMLVIHGESAEHPEALPSLWPSQEIGDAYRAFDASYRPLAETLDDAAFAPIDAIAARTLLIHDWRRIVLRDPGLPAALLPQDWPGETARGTARQIYAKLATSSEAWLDGAGLPGQGYVWKRFRG
jgi:phenylacetic acid degradation operon negative regulatory protein